MKVSTEYYKWSQTSEILKGGNLISNWRVNELQLALGLGWWDLKQGQRLNNWDPMTRAECSEDVEPTDFPFVGLLIPVYSTLLRDLIGGLGIDEIQYLPLRLIGESTHQEISGYSIANYLSSIDCLDRERSQYRVWTKENLLFWEKRQWMLGTYEFVRNPVIQAAKIGDASLFRMWGWDMVICREDVKVAIEQKGVLGCRFYRLEVC